MEDSISPAENLSREAFKYINVVTRGLFPLEHEGLFHDPEMGSIILHHRESNLNGIIHARASRIENAITDFISTCPRHLQPDALGLVERIGGWADEAYAHLYPRRGDWRKMVKGMTVDGVHADFDWLHDWEDRVFAMMHQLSRFNVVILAWLEDDDHSNHEHTGPVPPNLFFYKGNSEQLQPAPYRLLEFLWYRRRVTVDDAHSAVFGDNSSGDIKSAVRRAKETIESLEAPYDVHIKAGYLELETLGGEKGA